MNHTTNPHGKATPSEQIKAFCTLYEADDVIEVRRLPSGRKTWHLAGELFEQAESLAVDNEHGENIHPGVNPRTHEGGSKSTDVKISRVLWADFDGVSPEDALAKCRDADMPTPTMATNSGHGCHCFWRLIDSIPVATWSQWQLDLAHTVGSDPAIHDAPRLTRLPGYTNHKEPAAPCDIVEHHPEAVYDLSDFHECIKPAPATIPVRPVPLTVCQTPGAGGLKELSRATYYATKWEQSIVGQRNRDALRHAAALVNDFTLSDDQAFPILSTWNSANPDPLDETELRTCLVNGRTYAKRPLGNKLPGPDTLPVAKPLWWTPQEIFSRPTYREGMLATSTGFRRLDDILGGGWRNGCLYVVGGRVGSAKSMLAGNFARLLALDGVPVLYAKLEESVEEGLFRIHAAAGQFPVAALLDGELKGEWRTRIEDGWKLLHDIPLRITDVNNLDGLSDMVRLHATQNGGPVILDQLSMVQVDGVQSQYEKTTMVSNRLRLLAKECRIPIIAISQVSREASKGRKAGELEVSDLRETGHLEADAAAVLFIDKTTMPERGLGQSMLRGLSVCKNRYGKCTDTAILVDWWPWMARLVEVASG